MVLQFFGHFDPIRPHHKGLVVDAVGIAVHLTGAVVVALQEFGPQRQHLLFKAVYSPIDKGQLLARILQQPRLPVPGLALVGIKSRAEIGVALQHDLTVGIVLHHHERAGTHRPPVQGEVALGKPRIVVEAVHFRGDR